MAVKGKTNNPNGRPVGSVNKSTAEIKEMVNSFVSNNLETMQSDFDKLEQPKDRLQFMEKMMSYVVPKLQATAISAEVRGADMDIAPITWVKTKEVSDKELDTALEALFISNPEKFKTLH